MIDSFEHLIKERLINYSKKEGDFNTLSMSDDIREYIRFIDYLEDNFARLENLIERQMSEYEEGYSKGYEEGYEDGKVNGHSD